MKRLDILHFLFDENDKLYGNTVSQDKIRHYICEKNITWKVRTSEEDSHVRRL